MQTMYTPETCFLAARIDPTAKFDFLTIRSPSLITISLSIIKYLKTRSLKTPLALVKQRVFRGSDVMRAVALGMLALG